MTEPEQLKGLGNTALQAGQYQEAIQYYTEAIEIAQKRDLPTHVYYSNRAAAQTQRRNYVDALADAEKCIAAKPDWPKGYGRKGTALSFLSRFAEAEAAIKQGLEVDPNNAALKESLAEVQKQLTGPGNSQPVGSPFGNPAEMMQKLASNPETKEFMKDPSYIQMLQSLQGNPQNIMKFMGDPRMMKTLKVMTGIDFENMGEKMKNQPPAETPMDTSSNEAPREEPAPKQAKTEDPKVEEMVEDDIEEDVEEVQRKKNAATQKQLGTDAYKAKNFAKAIEHYQAAHDLDQTNMVYHLNLAAVALEQKNYEQCREYCQKAVDIGRSNRADYKMIAKAIARVGTSYEREDNKKNDPEMLKKALNWYNKSLSETRDKNIVANVKKIEKKLKELEKLALIDPEKFEELKAEGNNCFKTGDFPGAIKKYDEARKRLDEKDLKLAALFSNKAAALSKLMEYPSCISACEQAIKVDKNFTKAYLRKANALEAMKKHSEAQSSYEEALKIDPASSEAQQGYQRCVEATYATRNDPEKVKERAQNDPEVRAILQDPGMQIILEQMQKDPKAAQEHLRNPEIATKIQKLVDVGIIGMR